MMTAKVLTANRLDDGVVVFLAPDATWTEVIHDARVARTEDAHAELETRGRKAETEEVTVTGSYLIDVEADDDGRLRPSRWRERIRAFGPPVHPDFAREDVPGHFKKSPGAARV